MLPTGQISKKAQDCLKKDLRSYRKSNTRKVSQIASIEDFLNYFLVSSDSHVTGFRILPTKRNKTLDVEAVKIIENVSNRFLCSNIDIRKDFICINIDNPLTKYFCLIIYD